MGAPQRPRREPRNQDGAAPPYPPPTPPQDLCRRGPPRRGPRRLKSTAPGTYAAGAPVSTLRWRETPQGAGEPHDTPSHKRTRHNSSYVLRTSRLAAPGPHRVRHAGRFTGHSGPILPGGVFFAAPMPGSDTYGPGTAAPRTRRPLLHAPPPPPFRTFLHPSIIHPCRPLHAIRRPGSVSKGCKRPRCAPAEPTNQASWIPAVCCPSVSAVKIEAGSRNWVSTMATAAITPPEDGKKL